MVCKYDHYLIKGFVSVVYQVIHLSHLNRYNLFFHGVTLSDLKMVDSKQICPDAQKTPSQTTEIYFVCNLEQPCESNM